ncbi:MAG TPA: TatD family hydrolase [Dehalococcoidia bacterium]|nr:TatD family hydrolase [Dehalococcoidia bacterium]
MTVLFDSHCHLQDPAFAGKVGEAIERAATAGVGALLVLGYNVPSNHSALEIASRHGGVAFAAVGIHPHDAVSAAHSDLEGTAALARLPEVLAIGEIGLDFYRNLSPPEKQVEVLRAQLEIALDVGKPVSVHSRGAEDKLVAHLSSFAVDWQERYADRSPGVMHCFGGSAREARSYAEMGFMISLACTVTYPKNETTREVAASLDSSSILVETDSPYLPPQASRGQRNEPANVVVAAKAVADARGSSLEEVARLTTANAERLFGISVRRPAAAGAS